MNLLLAALAYLMVALPVSAHPGNTAADGCHYCRTNCDRWGVPWNERHCHGGGSIPIHSLPPAPIIPDNPVTQARVSAVQSDTKPYSFVTISWDVSGTHQYSISMTRVAGVDPGPKIDTDKSTMTFRDVASGRWYINLKTTVNGVWSSIRYWTVDVPDWIDPTPTLTPTPTPGQTPTITPTPIVLGESTNNDSGAAAIGLISFGLIGGGLLSALILRKGKTVSRDS